MSLGLTLWALTLVVLVWWGPGWLLGEALGVRRLLLPAVAPVIGIGLLTTIGVLGEAVGLPWAPVPVLLAVLLVCGAATVVRLRVRNRRAGRAAGAGAGAAEVAARAAPSGPPAPHDGGVDPRRHLWILAAGLLVGAAIGAITWVKGSAVLAGINQDWDIPWHANMVRLIAESRLWDPGIAGNFAYFDTVIAEAPIRGYPIAFHAALALVWPMSGLTIPTFLNVVVLVVVAVQLPLSAMALASLITRHPVALAASAAVSTWFAAFPYDMLWRGPLIPLVAGLVLIGPFALLAARGAVERRWWWSLGVALGAVGILAIHPSLAFVAIALLVFWFIGALIAAKGRVLGVIGFLVLAGALAVVIGWPVITWMLGESERVADVTWAADTDHAGAIDNLLFIHHGSLPMTLGTAMVVMGVVAMLFRPRTWWYFGPPVIAGMLAHYTMSTDDERYLWATAPFYDDQWRIFGIFVMFLAPIAGLGIYQVARTIALAWIRATSRRAAGAAAAAPKPSPSPTSTSPSPRPGTKREVLTTAAVAGAIVTLAGLGSIPIFKDNVNRVSPSTVVEGPTLSAGEIRLMTEINTWVPEDATVLNDSCDGSVWMYALGDRMPMIRHFEVLPTNRQLLLWQGFPRLAADADVREAAAQMGIEWVYVADGRIREWDQPKEGLTDLADLPFLTLVAREDNASLYRIDWAELPDGEELLERYEENLLRQPGVAGVWENADPDKIAPLGWIC